MGTAANKPNILFIMADQHHAGRLGCCGDSVVQTPQHDRIANEGVRFTSAYANSPICGPSRSCFFSGRYVHQHGVYLNSGMDPACSEWMTGHFREHGYTTAGVGKMHMGPLWVASQLDYIRNENIFDAPHDDLFGPMGAHYYSYLAENGLWEKCEFMDSQKAGPWPCRTWPLPEEYSPEAWIGRETVRYLREQPSDKPFFLHVSFPRPHDPLYVPEPFDTMYDPDTIPLPPNAADNFRTKSPRSRAAWECLKTKERVYPYLASSSDELRRIEARYYGLISLNDKYIGLILDELEARGILDDTIIVFTADHGDFAGEHGLHFKNLGIYEPVHRIPLLLRSPGRIAAGTISDLLVESVDLYPTLCDLAGLPVPDRISGASVMPALE
ncbi:MAG: sulfatase-like hydrolase/transferase, partial [Kiritimatiellaeota bacterium]|nr:sulfatase-like hydrolase/transferase [Kiritimatiellota bacterium]